MSTYSFCVIIAFSYKKETQKTGVLTKHIVVKKRMGTTMFIAIITTFETFKHLLVRSETGLPPNRAGICRLLFKYFSENFQYAIKKVLISIVAKIVFEMTITK